MKEQKTQREQRLEDMVYRIREWAILDLPQVARGDASTQDIQDEMIRFLEGQMDKVNLPRFR